MPGRGFATALILLLSALACVAAVRRVERDRRLLAKLRSLGASDPRFATPLDRLSSDERDTALLLAQAAVLSIRNNRVHIVESQLDAFRRKRTRLAVCGACSALLLVVLLAVSILRR